ncbi:MAG TPA: ABC-type transport auxiliary lipoprotein family protein [Steroidobacteraceae bacterium]|nr:ABC-type transport auxiliary lipoprotein family protein [Steroidobacteraceae bacterium]
MNPTTTTSPLAILGGARPRAHRADAREGPVEHLRLPTLVLLGLVLGGCSSLLRSNAPPVQVYTLRIAGGASSTGAADAHPAVAASLRVAHPLAGPGLGTSQIVLLQPDQRMNVYAASAWAADVPALVESLVTQTLRSSGEWRTVEDAESPFPADYLLQISIRSFDADYSAGSNVPPTVHVALDCTLGAEEGRTILTSFVAQGSAAAGANKLNEVVAAFQQATDQALASLSQQAFAAVRGTAPAEPGSRASRRSSERGGM